jgi:3'-phosphoadenosine 5'-phosphosulfate sulfotransferase (PAPS reductase)/FAD synthetase
MLKPFNTFTAGWQVPYNLNYFDGSFFLSGYYNGKGKPQGWQLFRATGAFPYTLQVRNNQTQP